MNTKPKHPTIAMSAPAKESNQVAAFGYDAASKTLAVKFKHGGSVYHYHDVAPETHAAMLKAESDGKFVHATFVKPKHKFTKIDS